MLIENSPRMAVLWETQTATEALSEPGSGPSGRHSSGSGPRHRERNRLCCRALWSVSAPARILVLTALADTQQHLAAVAAGASGVVLKEQAPETLDSGHRECLFRRSVAGEIPDDRGHGQAVAGILGETGSRSREDRAAHTPRSRDRGAWSAKGSTGSESRNNCGSQKPP